MHTLLDYDGNLPAYVLAGDGKTADTKGAFAPQAPPEESYCVDTILSYSLNHAIRRSYHLYDHAPEVCDQIVWWDQIIGFASRFVPPMRNGDGW